MWMKVILAVGEKENTGAAGKIPVFGLPKRGGSYRYQRIVTAVINVKAKVKVLRYIDGTLAIHRGPRELARYDAQGQVVSNAFPVVA